VTRIHHFLHSDDEFRQQIEGLIMDDPVSIELEEEMSYSSLVAFIRPYSEG
jgi:hypothetical protein